MREIEFRGKRKDNDEWVYGSLVIDEDKYYIFQEINENIKRDDYEVYMLEVKPETICQYTGLKDKNGNKIFEGDIIKFQTDDDYEVYEKICKIVFEKAEFLVKDSKTKFGPKFIHIRLIEELEVIGNIHDNPELLEE